MSDYHDILERLKQFDREKKPMDEKEGPEFRSKEEAIQLPKPSESEESKSPEQRLDRVQEILKEYDNQESRIPLDSEYWTLLNQHRAEQNK